jgi:hypothetical protein
LNHDCSVIQPSYTDWAILPPFSTLCTSGIFFTVFSF